ncbi:MAG TPA: S41 family peptidase, partial [Dehalococcoidia bacterium]
MRLRTFPFPSTIQPSGRRLDQELDAALAEFEAQGVQSWVLDLRDNGGGSGLFAEALLGRFVAPGTLADHESDASGHLAEDTVDGHLFPVQRPLAVLVNERSASASEMTASTFREAGRALLVGQRTEGALANAVIWPVPEGGRIEIGFARVTTGIRDTTVDGVGVPVDVDVRNRTPADYAAGRDPQLAAAVEALQAGQVPAPQSLESGTAGNQADLQRLFGPLAQALSGSAAA